VTRETMSQASSIASMAQRLAQSLGVAFGAYALQISSLAQGHADIVTADFAPAFGAVALLSAASLFFHAALLPGAGAEVVGTRQGQVAAGRPAQADRNVALTATPRPRRGSSRRSCLRGIRR